MTTTSKNRRKIPAVALSEENQKATQQITNALDGAEFKLVKVESIAFSPLNYRKYISEEALQQFAQELKQHGIISPLTLRPLSANRYELVAGERRLRAAKLAGIAAVPASVANLSDEQVTEIQLAENLQRENPHPLEEAGAVKMMQDSGKSIQEIALRLGKSKAFVYSRIRLLALIEPFQEMFLGDAITIQEAFAIATLSADSQQDFFASVCNKWKNEKHFRFHNLDYALDRFRYDLKEAPFNTRDKKLLPDAGACTGCQFNTASLKSLFPEYAKQAICTNKDCYHKKCAAHMLLQLSAAIQEHQPNALLFNGEPSEYTLELVQSIPEAAALPCYSCYDISIYGPPEPPEREDYENGYDDDMPDFDEEGYKAALEEYQTETVEHNMLLQSGKVLKGVVVAEGQIKCVFFSKELPATRNRQQPQTAKQVQEAIKAGSATPELLQAEMERIQAKEIRAKEIDREKVQLVMHQQFTEVLENGFADLQLTPADHAAARLLVYQSLDYKSLNKVKEMLLPNTDDFDRDNNDQFYEWISGLTDSQFSYLIRMAVTGKPESKSPNHITAAFLYKVARGAALNIEAIEQQQAQKAATRQTRVAERIKELEKRIGKLKAKE